MASEYRSVPEGIILVATLLFWSVLLDALAYRFPGLGRILKAQPKALIEDGRANRRVMQREFLSADELASQLRLHGVTDIAQVKRAYLEPNGMISLVRVDDAVPERPEVPPALK